MRAQLELHVLANPKNPHTIETLKWHASSFTQSFITNMRGLQEAIVGLLVTLNPKDREGKEVFRASEYGQTEDEKKLKREFTANFVRQQFPHLQGNIKPEEKPEIK